jgi:Ca2+-binding RTX toxin-like protein
VDITAGDAVMSAATFAGDNTFLLVDGANGNDEVLTVGTTNLTTVQTIDASNVTFDIDKQALVKVTGGTKDDILTGSSRATTIDGLAGNDTITGGGSADIIGGDEGMDIIVGGGGADTIAGDTDNDTITGGEGADVITGGAGVDTIILTETVAAADDVVINDDTAGNHSVITGWGTGDQIKIDESEFATIAFAATVAPADLAAADYVELAAGQTLETQHVNVITTAAGYAGYDDAFAGVTAVGGVAAAPGFVLFYNSTTEKTEMYYDADLRDAAGEVLVAQIDIAGANVAGLSEASFTVF